MMYDSFWDRYRLTGSNSMWVVYTALKGTDRMVAPSLRGCYGGHDHDKTVFERACLVNQIGSDLDRTCWIHQVHGSNIRMFTLKQNLGEGAYRVGARQADVMITNIPGAVLALRFADCPPLLVRAVASDGRVWVLAAHCGTLGLINRLPIVAMERLCRLAHVTPRDLDIWIGPMISLKHYQFDHQSSRDQIKIQAFESCNAVRWISNRPHLGVQLMLEYQLVEFGVDLQRVTIEGICTCDNPWMWSFRGALYETGSGFNRDDNVVMIKCQ